MAQYPWRQCKFEYLEYLEMSSCLNSQTLIEYLNNLKVSKDPTFLFPITFIYTLIGNRPREPKG